MFFIKSNILIQSSFQELHLSRRCLIFVHQQSYFRCQKYGWSWREDILSEDETIGNYPENTISRRPSNGDRDSAYSWTEFETLIEDYGLREFTYDSDALNAITGVLQRFETSMRCLFLQGLPTSFLNYHILFTCKHYARCSNKLRREAFPSYTWVGWRRTVKWGLWFGDPSSPALYPFWHWLKQGTWIKFYVLQPDGSTEEVLDSNRQLQVRDSSNDGIEFPKSQPFKDSKAVTQQTPLLQQFGRTYPMLRFWTVTVRYTIVATENPYFSDLHTRDGHRCGDIELDDRLEPDSVEPHEFLVLSQAPERSNPSLNCNGSGYFCGNWTYYSYFVMLITRDTHGVAERRGIGRVTQSSPDMSYEPGPKWEEIILG